MEQNKITYKEDSILLTEGQDTDYMYHINSGSVALYLNYGKPEEILLGICSKGKVFGEMCMLSSQGSIYTAVAVTDVELVKITQDNFVEFVKSYPACVLGILKNMANTNNVLKANINMLVKENYNRAEADKRKKQLDENLAKYSARGVSRYMAEYGAASKFADKS